MCCYYEPQGLFKKTAAYNWWRHREWSLHCNQKQNIGRSSAADITVDNLKFRPITAHCGTYTYNASPVIVNYLKPLFSNNEYIIRNTPKFAKIIREQDPLKSNEQYVCYDVESLFINVPVHEIIEYIITELCVESKLLKLCSKLIFER